MVRQPAKPSSCSPEKPWPGPMDTQPLQKLGGEKTVSS